MRILFVHPNYPSGGAEIAGTWPPAWVAYLSGHLRNAGFDDIEFIDAMTDNIADADPRQGSDRTQRHLAPHPGHRTGRGARCRETHCGAQGGGACEFTITLRPDQAVTHGGLQHA